VELSTNQPGIGTHDKKEKSGYRKPTLRHFGLVSQLTAGGSAVVSEINPHDKCGNQNPHKQRC
jgi:hypothetical protein